MMRYVRVKVLHSFCCCIILLLYNLWCFSIANNIYDFEARTRPTPIRMWEAMEEKKRGRECVRTGDVMVRICVYEMYDLCKTLGCWELEYVKWKEAPWGCDGDSIRDGDTVIRNKMPRSWLQSGFVHASGTRVLKVLVSLINCVWILCWINSDIKWVDRVCW